MTGHAKASAHQKCAAWEDRIEPILEARPRLTVRESKHLERDRCGGHGLAIATGSQVRGELTTRALGIGRIKGVGATDRLDAHERASFGREVDRSLCLRLADVPQLDGGGHGVGVAGNLLQLSRRHDLVGERLGRMREVVLGALDSRTPRRQSLGRVLNPGQSR